MLYDEDIAQGQDGNTPSGVPGTWHITVTLSETSGTFNFRGGYRLFSWLAFEGMYEGAYGLTTKLTEDLDVGGGITIPAGKIATLDTHSVLANLKLIIPIWRTQPYIVVGVGGQQHATTFVTAFDTLETSRWDFVIRPGAGLDAYITKNWLLNVEIAPSVSVRMPGGSLDVQVGDDFALRLTGPASRVMDGRLGEKLLPTRWQRGDPG